MNDIRADRVADPNENALNRGRVIAAGGFAAGGGHPAPHTNTEVADAPSAGMKELAMTAHARGNEERK